MQMFHDESWKHTYFGVKWSQKTLPVWVFALSECWLLILMLYCPVMFKHYQLVYSYTVETQTTVFNKCEKMEESSCDAQKVILHR